MSAKIAGLQAVKFWHVRSDRPEMFEDPSGQWVAASDYDRLAELFTRNVAYTEGIVGQLGKANKRVELLQAVCADLRKLVKMGGQLATHATQQENQANER